jgi:hypothetical protein
VVAKEDALIPSPELHPGGRGGVTARAPRLEEALPGNLHSPPVSVTRQPHPPSGIPSAPPVQPDQQQLQASPTDIDKILKFIRTTKTESRLTVGAYLMPENYDTGVKISDAEMRQLNLVPHEMLGRWNYTVHPAQNVN